MDWKFEVLEYGVSVGVVGDCVCFAAWIGGKERGACAGVCRGNEAEEDRELQCKPLLEVEEEEEQEGSFTSSATEEHRRGRQEGRETERGRRGSGAPPCEQ